MQKDGSNKNKVRVYSPEAIDTIDERLCRLHSLGTLLTQVCQAESILPDYPSLADLGRVIADEADLVLNMIQDGEHHNLDITSQP